MRRAPMAFSCIGLALGALLAVGSTRWPDGAAVSIMMLSAGGAMVSAVLVGLFVELFLDHQRRVSGRVGDGGGNAPPE